MDHNLSYKGPIWVIQNPNIKLLNTATIFIKETSPISSFFLIENQSQNLDVGSKHGSLWQSWKMDHNLSYRGQIWAIQKPNFKFTIVDKISKNNTSPNSFFF